MAMAAQHRIESKLIGSEQMRHQALEPKLPLAAVGKIKIIRQQKPVGVLQDKARLAHKIEMYKAPLRYVPFDKFRKFFHTQKSLA